MRAKSLTFLMIFCFTWSFWTTRSLASPPIAATEEMPRRILAIYDPTETKALNETPLHRHLEIVLNHLGLEVSYRSARAPLPSAEEMRGVRGIITWFYEDVVFAEPDLYCRWLSDNMARGVKWVSLGKPGLLKPDEGDLSVACEQTFLDLGAEYLSESTIDELFLEIVDKDPGMVEFERPLNFTEDLRYVLIRPDSSAKIYARLKRTDLDESESALVFTTPRGGYVNAGFVIYEDKVLGKIKWRLNPFRFFEEALQLQGLPRPDVTTLNGRRLFMTHIDGDGIFNLSHIDRKSFSAEIIRDEILRAYADLPHSVSIITGYLDMKEYQSPRALTLYSELLGPDNVEVASHGHAHPLVWNEGTVALKVPGYTFDAKYEIQGSVDRVRELLKILGIPKPVDLFFWTGDCVPTKEQLVLAREGGFLHINGGDSRFDRIYDSYAFLSPHGLLRNNDQQIYASFPNENVFTNLWKGPFYGFRDIVDSFRNTESPIRLKAIDIYYHFYSGERVAALMALKKAFDYALSQEIFPVFISEYVRIARDFYGTRIRPLAGQGFHVETAGDLKTIRFDNTNLNVDFARSRNVMGFRHFQGSLYVALGDGNSHDVFLTAAAPSRPYLVQATFHIRDFSTAAGGLHFFKKGWYKSEAAIAGMTPNAVYSVKSDGTEFKVSSDATGQLQLQFPGSEKNGSEVEVTITRESL